MQYWLMKSEPEAFSIDDLKALAGRQDGWDGVRNYQARNFIKQMQKGDLAFFYHSNCEQPGIVGVMKIISAPYADDTALDPKSKYYDPKSTPDNPRWFRVDVQYKKKFKDTIALSELKTFPQLDELPLVRKGNRLSVMPVQAKEWEFILSLQS